MSCCVSCWLSCFLTLACYQRWFTGELTSLQLPILNDQHDPASLCPLPSSISSSSFPFVLHLLPNYTTERVWEQERLLIVLLHFVYSVYSVVLLIRHNWLQWKVITDKIYWLKAVRWIACWLLVQLEVILGYSLFWRSKGLVHGNNYRVNVLVLV